MIRQSPGGHSAEAQEGPDPGVADIPEIHRDVVVTRPSRRCRNCSNRFNMGAFMRPRRWERVSTERLGKVLPAVDSEHEERAGATPRRGAVARMPAAVAAVPLGGADDEVVRDDEAVEFVRFCYRRRAVAWPELYDEMCGVAAREEYCGMSYEQLEHVGIGLALQALPRLAAMVAQVIAEERGATRASATA